MLFTLILSLGGLAVLSLAAIVAKPVQATNPY